MLSKLQNHILSRFPSVFWRTRHWHDPDWVKDGYCVEDPSSHQNVLLGVILAHIYKHWHEGNGIGSILEAGCGGGRNLYHLARFNQAMDLFGIDISSKAVADANHWLANTDEQIRDIRVFQADLRKLEKRHEASDHTFDLIFSDATMIYIRDDEIKTVLSELVKICNKVLIFSEWHADCEKSFTFDGHWVHNYNRLLPGACARPYPEGSWDSEGWCKYGHIITYEL